MASLLAAAPACSRGSPSPSSLPGASAAANAAAYREHGRSAALPTDTCVRSTEPPLVTDSSIGVLDFRRTVADLRRLCPSVQSDFVYGEESINNALLFYLGSVVVRAWQAVPAGNPLVDTMPAEFWRVAGAAVRLPSGLSLASRWGALRATYGPASARIGPSRNSVEVNFCSQPRLDFTVALDSVSGGGYTDDLSFIPDTAIISEVTVNAGPENSICEIRRRFVHQ
jgi:hypothetical protein